MKNFLHHLEYEESGLSVKDVRNNCWKKIFYDHKADKKEKKWNAQIYLEKENNQFLPEYILKTN